jgi:hypothetical protein
LEFEQGKCNPSTVEELMRNIIEWVFHCSDQRPLFERHDESSAEDRQPNY